MNVRTLCLGILAFKEASGYEIKKAVEDGMFSHFIEASYGSIYPALTHMLADGLVSVREQVQEGKPLKKAYSITEAGRKALKNALHEIPQQDKYKSEFLFQALFRNQVVLALDNPPARWDGLLGMDLLGSMNVDLSNQLNTR